MRLGGIGPDGEADRLAHLVLARSRSPGARQVTLGSVGVARGQVRREVAEVRRLGIERAASFDDHFAIFRFGPGRRQAFMILR